MSFKTCRFCGDTLTHSFVDLGMSPLSNAYIKPENMYNKESFYPLHAFVCEKCFLVQLDEFESPEEIFSDYAYFSSYSDSWLKHSKEYAERMINKLSLDSKSQVVELASNDGYLLQYFKEQDIPVLGIEPAKNVAEEAVKKGIPTYTEFFGEDYARSLVSQGIQADLLIGNNVLAHVPDLNDFVEGMKVILKADGVITVEFPHLLKLIEQNQFDTIYHEHFSYFSFITVQKVFTAHGLTIFDVDEISTHGGSLRIYAWHAENTVIPVYTDVDELLAREKSAGLGNIYTYLSFAEKVRVTKRKILEFLIRAKTEGKTIAGYGAPAKGNTLLNYCGIRTDFIDYTVDRNPYKQGTYLPGTHIPVRHPDMIRETKPDYVFILPWNLKNEIMEQLLFIRSWGGKFIVPIPEVEVL